MFRYEINAGWFAGCEMKNCFWVRFKMWQIAV